MCLDENSHSRETNEEKKKKKKKSIIGRNSSHTHSLPRVHVAAMCQAKCTNERTYDEINYVNERNCNTHATPKKRRRRRHRQR